MDNTLYYGDNLWVLQEHVRDEAIDLVYLDPPFNSQVTYNVLFKTPSGQAAEAQAEAFQDTWHWGEYAERTYEELWASGSPAAQILSAFRSHLGESDIMAYLTNMSIRLVQLHRCLKPTGSLYLHCDPTASHYLKIILDGIFSGANFRSEIIWKRTNARGTTGNWPRVHDVILYYAKGPGAVFHSQKIKADKAKLPHTLITGSGGQKYQTFELTAPGETKEGPSGKPWRGHNPGRFGRHWANSHSQMDAWNAERLIHWPKQGGFPRRRAAEPFDPESRKVTVGDVWTDIDRLNQTAKERLGFPTQKPLALLERIVASSSEPDQIVLDPFCGCGTTVHAAQALGRRWVGIDITHYAVTLIEDRMKKAFNLDSIAVIGRPNDLASAHDLARRDKYQFQWWANWLVGVQNYRERRKGADRGIDGIIFFRNGPRATGRVVVSVKGGEKIGPDMVRDLRGTVEREGAELGLFVTLKKPTSNMVTEAATAGLVQTAQGKYPKIQIVTIEELLSGKRPALPQPFSISLDERKLIKQREKGAKSPQREFTFAVPGGKLPTTPSGDVLYPAEVELARSLTSGSKPARAAAHKKKRSRQTS